MSKKYIFLSAATALALLLSGFVLYPMISDGMRVGPDGAKYLNSAVNLTELHEITVACSPDTIPNTIAAPGYIMVLAVPIWLGLNWLASAQIVSLICYFLLLVGTAAFVRRYTASFILALAAEAVVGLHPVLLNFIGVVLSEPLSWLFVIAINYFILKLIKNPGKQAAICLGITLGLAVLVRYAFIAFLVSSPFILLLLVRRISPRKAVILLGFSILISLLIFGPWLVRNWLLTKNLVVAVRGSGTLKGNSILASLSWWEIILGIKRPPLPWAAFIYAPLAGLVITAVLRYKHLLSGRKFRMDAAVYLINFLLTVGYLISVIFICTFINPAVVDRRLFSPLVIMFALMMATLPARGTVQTSLRRNRKVYTIILYFLWVVWIIIRGIGEAGMLRKGTKGYFDWKSSPTLAFAVDRFKPAEILVTDPEPFWLWHRIYPRYLPGKSEISPESARFEEEGIKAFVWFKKTHRIYLIQPPDIIWNSPFRAMEFEDGWIYLLSPRRE